MFLQQNTTPKIMLFSAFGSTVAPLILEIAKNGLGLAAGTGTVDTGYGNGRTAYTFAAGELDTLGEMAVLLVGADGSFLSIRYFQVVPFNPNGANYGGGSGGDPWETVLPGAYLPGEAGYIVGKNLNAAVSAVIYFLTQGKLPPGIR